VYLDPASRAAWTTLYPKISARRVIPAEQEPIFARYCMLWARWMELARLLPQTGWVYRMGPSRPGQVRVIELPQSREMRSLCGLLLELERQLGIAT
jgi:hypothetical protein